MAQSSKNISLVALGDVDAPEAVPAPRPYERGGLSGIQLDDVFGSLPRTPSSSGPLRASPSGSSSSSSTVIGDEQQQQQHSIAPRLQWSANTSAVAPSAADLYGERTRHRHAAHRSVHTRREKKHKSLSRMHTKNSVLDVEVAASAGHGDGDDALLKKMQQKEKEFDTKIKEINNTFFSAGRQLVVRDDIIESLQAELARMRSQEHRRTEADEQRYREKEQELLRQCDRAVAEAQGEVTELRVALKAGAAQQQQQQDTIDQLVQQLTASDARAREARVQHKERMETIRCKCDEQLRAFDRKLAALQASHAAATADRDALQSDQTQCAAKLLAMELAQSQQRSGETKAMRDLWREKETLLEEVEVVRLSMARLLQILSEVPAMKNYLQWSELDSNFVFLGFPTRYFSLRGEQQQQQPDLASAERARGAPRNRKSPASVSFRAPRNDGSDSDTDGLAYAGAAGGGGGGVRPGTGVDDGIYAGASSFADSKNVWLNGRWIQQLQEIINAENAYTRLKKIKLYELEEAAQVSDGLPTSRDVLQCRRQEKDYWVPYAVFEEAQKFKNRYCPKVPALSHFYPFLLKLNGIWRARVQDKLRALKKELQDSQQRATALKRASFIRTLSNSSSSIGGGGGHGGRSHISSGTTSSGLLHTQSSRSHDGLRSAQPWRAQLIGLTRAIADWESQAEHLRREVRLSVTSQRSLQLFRLYGELLQACLGTVRQLTERCEQLEEETALAASLRAAQDSIREDDWGKSRPYLYGDAEDISDDESGGSEQETPVRPLPPPRERQRSLPRRSRQRSHGHAASSQAVSVAPQNNEEVVEALLCVVQHSSERVCGVADHLVERTQACCTDLESLLTMLQDACLPSADAAQPSRPAQSHAATTPSTSGMFALQQQIRDLLRDQYGPGLDVTLSQRAKLTPSAGETQASSLATTAPSRTDKVLSSMVASALDFSRELRGEVLQAQTALQAIASEAVKEAEEC